MDQGVIKHDMKWSIRGIGLGKGVGARGHRVLLTQCPQQGTTPSNYWKICMSDIDKVSIGAHQDG